MPESLCAIFRRKTMSDNNPISDIAKISKPINTLIEKIADAIGIRYEPKHIVRKAKAEAKANEIMAISDIKIKKLQYRALKRFVYEETQKQENIESLIDKTLPKITTSSKTESIEKDWLVKYFENAKLISDEDMQNIWSNILAGESNKPGTFSKRTLSVISELDKKDAILFTNLCKFAFSFEEKVIVVFDLQDELYSRNDITFRNLTHLDNAGLLRFNDFTGFQLKNLPKNIELSYNDNLINIEFSKDENNNLDIGKVLLSETGQQLTSICTVSFEDEILNYTIENWKKKSLKVTLKNGA